MEVVHTITSNRRFSLWLDQKRGSRQRPQNVSGSVPLVSPLILKRGAMFQSCKSKTAGICREETVIAVTFEVAMSGFAESVGV